MEYDLFCRLRVHARPALTDKALDHLALRLPAANVSTFVVVCRDRTTPEVDAAIDKYRDLENVMVMDAPVPVMTAKYGQRWIEVLNAMSDAFDAAGHTAHWSADTDDDVVFGPGWSSFREAHSLYGCLHDESVVAWEAISLFVWDDKGNVNLRQYHWSPWLSRYHRGDRRLPSHDIRVSDRIQAYINDRPQSLRILPFYLLDYGTTDAKERETLYREYARAGKNDPYTRKYIQKPILRRLEEILVQYPRPADFKLWQMGVVMGDVKIE